MNSTQSEISTNKFRVFVKPLSQNELAAGWKLVVPKVKRIRAEQVDEKGNNTVRVSSNIYKAKINLAQLPSYLWHKVRDLKHNNRINDNCHYYYIEPTEVDSEITELVKILKKDYSEDNTSRVQQLLNKLKEHDIYGWPTIQATELYL
jgi:hypothetical protein